MTFPVAAVPVARNEAGIAAVLPFLEARFGERFLRSEAIRRQHGATTTWLATQPPTCPTIGAKKALDPDGIMNPGKIVVPA